MDEFYEANRKNWDERAEIHARSETYGLHRFVEDPDRLSEVVEFDKPWLGDLTGLSAIHLQCHIGTDTLSLARLGATVAGLDQSPASLAHAEQLFASTGTAGSFTLAGVYDAVEALGQTYDLVYTGVGALNWLPDIGRWAEVVAALMNPGGRLYLREGHPMLMTLDETVTDQLVIRYPYYETDEPMTFDEPQTYTDGDQRLANTRTYEWSHGIGEVVSALLGQGLTLTALEEHRTLEWQFSETMVLEDGKWMLPADQRDLVPLMYTVVAAKPA